MEIEAQWMKWPLFEAEGMAPFHTHFLLEKCIQQLQIYLLTAEGTLKAGSEGEKQHFLSKEMDVPGFTSESSDVKSKACKTILVLIWKQRRTDFLLPRHV